MVDKAREYMIRGCIEAFGLALLSLIAIVSILLLMNYIEIGPVYKFVVLLIFIFLLIN